MEYNELFEKYRKLLEENQRLKNDNEYFRKRLGLPLPSPYIKNDVQASIEVNDIQLVEVIKPGHVTNSSSPEDKINLFMSLFRGRDDVYAKRWQNKEGKSGYSPVCLNERARGICNKPKIKCSECGNRNYAVLDFAAIDKHLRGKDVFGVYLRFDSTLVISRVCGYKFALHAN
ncbi:hypothetical protein SDC9_33826 [bioreactor metagenome]|uniref:TOTE conflict system primase domain-containing protein n=1 Tax=bioreactor metagenome TaxID=1076179 RepID=A0A644V8X8_9ZZZZ